MKAVGSARNYRGDAVIRRRGAAADRLGLNDRPDVEAAKIGDEARVGVLLAELVP